MVSNINGISSTHSSTSRSREKTQSAEQPVKASSSNTDASAKVSLSSEAKELQGIEAGIKRFPEVNQERVSQLRDTLREGNYSVDPARLAAKIVQFELDI